MLEQDERYIKNPIMICNNCRRKMILGKKSINDQLHTAYSCSECDNAVIVGDGDSHIDPIGLGLPEIPKITSIIELPVDPTKKTFHSWIDGDIYKRYEINDQGILELTETPIKRIKVNLTSESRWKIFLRGKKK